MFIIDLFNEIDFDDIWNKVKERHPILLSDSFTTLSDYDKKIVLKNSYYTMKSAYIKMQSMECLLDKGIIMIVVQEIDTLNVNKRRFTSYIVEKEAILTKKKSGDVTIWNDDNRVDYFGYNFLPWEEILGYSICELSLELEKIDLICEIFCEMTRFGFDEERISSLNKDLSRQLGDIKLSEEIDRARDKNIANLSTWFNNICDKIGISKAPKEFYGEVSQEKIIMKENHKIHMKYLNSID